MNTILRLHHDEMSDEDIQELTFELKNSLNQETDLTAQLPEETGGLGIKGDAVTIGQIFLAAVGGGGAIAALMPVLQVYFLLYSVKKDNEVATSGKSLFSFVQHKRHFLIPDH